MKIFDYLYFMLARFQLKLGGGEWRYTAIIILTSTFTMLLHGFYSLFELLYLPIDINWIVGIAVFLILHILFLYRYYKVISWEELVDIYSNKSKFHNRVNAWFVFVFVVLAHFMGVIEGILRHNCIGLNSTILRYRYE